MDIKETIEFLKIVNALKLLYPKLPNFAAITAVNFFKERFVLGRDINNITFKSRADKRDRKRAILVGKGSGILKRDIQKLKVTADYAIVGTTRLSAPYAKAHNEGFSGIVSVKAHTRVRYKKVKEKYTTKKGNEKTRTSKQVDSDSAKIQVGTFRRKMHLPKRQFMGASAFLDRRIQKLVTEQMIKTILANSSKTL
jgi:hypothetical protein